MPRDQLVAFIDRHTAAWNRHDPAALAANHAEDGVILSPMFARVEGRPQILASYLALFNVFPDWQLRYFDPTCEANRVAVSFAVSATHKGEFMGLPGTGRRCEFEGVSLFELDDRLLIREERRVYDFTGLLTRLGVLKVKPAL
jgi:steroid delta-isomerase-like uncharacterized protein